MSAASAALQPDGDPGTAGPLVTAALLGTAAHPAPSAIATPARARMAPLVERPARVARAPGPLLAPPPVAGSEAALTRHRPVGADGDPAGAHAVPVRLPDPTKLCCAMVQAAVEALRGTRPLAQLARWVSPEIYDELLARSLVTQRVLGRSEAPHHAAIRRIRLCRLGENAAEASVVVEDGARVRAVAVRLEGHRGQWRATALVIG